MTKQEKKVGAVLRMYSSDESRIEQRAEKLHKTIKALRTLRDEGAAPLDKVCIAIWANPDFDESDCGKTKSFLEGFYGEDNFVVLKEITSGGPFVTTLNNAIFTLARDHNITHAFALSAELGHTLSAENMRYMWEAFEKGALVSGVAFGDLKDQIMEGFVSNTCAMWDVESLMTVGGFQIPAEKRIYAEMQEYVQYDGINIPRAGVEEIMTLYALQEHVAHNRPFIAPVLPRDIASTFYDVVEGDEQRHRKKIETKVVRQNAFAELMNRELKQRRWAGRELRPLHEMIVPGYRLEDWQEHYEQEKREQERLRDTNREVHRLR